MYYLWALINILLLLSYNQDSDASDGSEDKSDENLEEDFEREEEKLANNDGEKSSMIFEDVDTSDEEVSWLFFSY